MDPDPQAPRGLGRLGKLRRYACPGEGAVPPRTDGDEDAVELDRLAVGDDAVVRRCREPFGDLLPRFVRRIEIDYLRPARLDDVLEVVTRCEEIGGASLTLSQEVRRGETLVVRARVTVVLVSSSGKPQRLGQLVRGALERFVNRAC